MTMVMPTLTLSRAVALLWFFLLGSMPLAAQTSWEEHTRLGELAFAVNNKERAEQEFRAALQLAQSLPASDRRLATSLRNLARILEHQSRWDEAQPLYELLLAVHETNLGQSHPGLLSTLAAAGRVAVRSGDVPSANAHLSRYVELADASGEAPQDQLQLVLSLLSRMYFLQERFDEALAMKRREVDLLNADARATPEQQATELFALGQLELSHGSATRAEQAYLAAIDLLPHGDGERSAELLLASAARTALDVAEPELAQRLAHRVVKTATGQPEALLEAHSVLAEAAWRQVHRGGASVGDLLSVASQSPIASDAEGRIAALLELQLDQLADTDPAIDHSLTRLVTVRALKGDAAAAAEAQQQLVSRRRQAQGVVPVALLEDLVILEQAAGRFAGAEQANSELIAGIERDQGEDSPELLPVLERQRVLLIELGRKKEARAIKKRVRALKKELGR